MFPFRVLVTRHVYAEALEFLEPPAEITYHDSNIGLSAGDSRRAVAGKHAVLCQLTDTIDADILAAGQELRIVANVAAGYDNIDVVAATRRGVVVTNTPGSTASPRAHARITTHSRRPSTPLTVLLRSGNREVA